MLPENLSFNDFCGAILLTLHQSCQLCVSSETLSSSTTAIEMGKGHCSPGIAKGMVASMYI